MNYSPRLSAIIAWLMFIADAIMFCTACSHGLHKSGTYKVVTASPQQGSTIVKFKGVKGQHLVLSDTIKPGDKVFIKVFRYNTHSTKKQNVFKTSN